MQRIFEKRLLRNLGIQFFPSLHSSLTDAGEDDHLPVLLDVGLDLDIVELLLEVEDVGVVGGEIQFGRDGLVWRRRGRKLHAVCRHGVL